MLRAVTGDGVGPDGDSVDDVVGSDGGEGWVRLVLDAAAAHAWQDAMPTGVELLGLPEGDGDDSEFGKPRGRN